jgi:hypothetical protein
MTQPAAEDKETTPTQQIYPTRQRNKSNNHSLADLPNKFQKTLIPDLEKVLMHLQILPEQSQQRNHKGVQTHCLFHPPWPVWGG